MNVLNIYLSIIYNIKYILIHIYIIDYYYAAFGIHRSREDLYILTWKDINYVTSNEQKMSNDTNTNLFYVCMSYVPIVKMANAYTVLVM